MARRLETAYADLRQGLWLWRAWVRLAWGVVRRPYRNSFLGPLWEPLGLVLLLALLGPLFARAFARPLEDYLVYLGAGWTVWHLMSGCILQGAATLRQAGGMLQQSRLPLSLFFFRTLLVELLEFALKIAVVLALIVLLGRPLGAVALLSLPGLLLLLVVMLGVIVLTALACVRVPDIRPVLGIALRLAFFLTPVLWDVQVLAGGEAAGAAEFGGRRGIALLYVDLNPLYHLLEIVRAPLLGEVPATHSWLFALGCAAAVWAVALPLFVRWRARVVYWV